MSRILIVDDSKLIRAEMVHLLQGHGHELVEAANGHEALDLIKANPDFAIVFTDLNMPGIDGIELIRMAKSLAPDFKSLLIMVTTETSFELKGKAKEAGIKYWINKPIEAAQIQLIMQKFSGTAA